MRNRAYLLSVVAAAVLLSAACTPPSGPGGTTTRVSVASDGTQADGQSGVTQNGRTGIAVSANGRTAVFMSGATNLVVGDTNGSWDVFASDLQSHVVTRVSVASDGTQSNGSSMDASVSADGRYVAYTSSATDLVAGDTNGADDVFVFDRVSHTTSRVSVATDGTQSNGTSSEPSISADGRYVAYTSSATDLVAGDTNGADDVFVFDRSTHVTRRASLATGGSQAAGSSHLPSISSDGHVVAFVSSAANLVGGDANHADDVFVTDWTAGVTSRVSVATGGAEADSYSEDPSISADGRYVSFASPATDLVPDDTNAMPDVFVRDRVNATTTRVSVSSSGAQANSASGGYQFPTGGGWVTLGSAISGDGRYVTFASNADDLVTGDTNGVIDVFCHDRQTGQTSRVSVATDGTQGDGTSAGPAASGDGGVVVYGSISKDLVPNDTNGVGDVFAFTRST